VWKLLLQISVNFVRLLKQIAWIKSPIFGLLVAICGWIRFS
jgi:hypothetical protein